MALPLTKTFTGSNGTALTTHDSRFVLCSGNFNIQSNALAANAALTECLAGYNGTVDGDIAADDQYASATLSGITATTNSSQGIGVRCKVDGTANGYGLYYNEDASEMYLFKLVAGVWTQLGATFALDLTAGNKIRLEVEGNVLRFLLDTGGGFVSQGTRTDSAFATGWWGVSGYGNATTNTIDDVIFGNIGAPPPSTVTYPRAAMPAMMRGVI